jgi:hypothetical protein
VYAQLDYVRNRKIGWERDHPISIPLSGKAARSFDILRAELLKRRGNLSVTAPYSEPTNFESSSRRVSWEGKNEEETDHVTLNLVDYGFLETLIAVRMWTFYLRKRTPVFKLRRTVPGLRNASFRFLRV